MTDLSQPSRLETADCGRSRDHNYPYLVYIIYFLGWVVFLISRSSTASASELGATADQWPTSVEGFEFANTLYPGAWFVKMSTQDLSGQTLGPKFSYGLKNNLELTLAPSFEASVGSVAMAGGFDFAVKQRLLDVGYRDLSILAGGGIAALTGGSATWNTNVALPVSIRMGWAGALSLCPSWRTWHGTTRPDLVEVGLSYRRPINRMLELWAMDTLIWGYGPNLEAGVAPALPWHEAAIGFRSPLVAGVIVDVSLLHIRTDIAPGPWTILPLFQVSVYAGNSGRGWLDAHR